MSYTQSLNSSTEIDVEVASPNYFLTPRIYEVHEKVSAFQLRAYILWAKKLYTPESSLSSFVRVFFVNECQKTSLAENSLNPMWNETLIFDKVFLYTFVKI